MFGYIALGVGAVAAFGLLGIALGIFRVGDALRNGLNAVAHAFSLYDDEEEEEWPPLDDVGFELDESDAQTFTEIAAEIEREESA